MTLVSSAIDNIISPVFVDAVVVVVVVVLVVVVVVVSWGVDYEKDNLFTMKFNIKRNCFDLFAC